MAAGFRPFTVFAAKTFLSSSVSIFCALIPASASSALWSSGVLLRAPPPRCYFCRFGRRGGIGPHGNGHACRRHQHACQRHREQSSSKKTASFAHHRILPVPCRSSAEQPLRNKTAHSLWPWGTFDRGAVVPTYPHIQIGGF